MGEITQILQSLHEGNREAGSALLELVYQELRQAAARKMASEAPGHTLQPTALVHEAWLRLGLAESTRWENRAHFFGAAAEAMRRILIDKARRKQRLRHGGGFERIDLEGLEIEGPESDDRMLLVHEALDDLAKEHPEKAEVVKLRFFVGLNNKEVADALGFTERTAERHWAFAKAWLMRSIQARS